MDKSAMNNDMISIIVPVYNAEKFLTKCLDSIINQTYKNIEIICVDDDSSDKSSKILNEFAEKDKRIKVIHKANEGVSLARNVGLESAKGNYILFVDSDDWIEQSTCEVAINKIIEENADIIMWPYVRERDGQSKRKQIFNKDITFINDEVQKKLHRRMVGIIKSELAQPENADALCTVWGKLYLRSIICNNKIRFYDIREIGTYEDGLFNLLYFQYVHKAVFLNQYLYHYRKTNEDSITKTYNAILEKQWDKLFYMIKNYISSNNLSAEYKEALNNRISLSLIPLGINELTQKCQTKKIIKNIKRIICKKEYVSSVKKLKIQYMPFHWKVFFKAAQKQKALIVFILLLAIQKIRGI